MERLGWPDPAIIFTRLVFPSDGAMMRSLSPLDSEKLTPATAGFDRPRTEGRSATSSRSNLDIETGEGGSRRAGNRRFLELSMFTKAASQDEKLRDVQDG